jgi:hypothetical protein
MRTILAIGLLVLGTITDAEAFAQTKFASEADAHQRCPLDRVVWLTLPGNAFVIKGDPRYGTTQRGAYMCERDAIAGGNRASH